MSALGKRVFTGPAFSSRKRRTMNATQTTQSSDASHDETPLDIIKTGWHIFRGPPNYTHVSLPYIYEQHFRNTQINTAEIGFRLTSPYNPHLGSDLNDNNPGLGTQYIYRSQTYAGDPKDKFDNVQFYDFYASMYNYYSVLSVRYHVTFENLTSEKMYLHVMNFNQEKPPEQATNHDMLLWSGVRSYLSTPHSVFTDEQYGLVQASADGTHHMVEDDTDVVNTGNAKTSEADWAVSRSRNSAVITFSDQYNAGDYQREIALDGDINTWTATNANPTYPERLLFRVRRYDDATPPSAGNTTVYDTALAFNLKVQIEYLTEFKELKAGLRYPVQRNPLSVTINQDGGSTN